MSGMLLCSRNRELVMEQVLELESESRWDKKSGFEFLPRLVQRFEEVWVCWLAF